MDTINKEKDMKPRIIQRRDINKQEWDKFVMESPYGWAFHLYDVIGVDRYKEDKDISVRDTAEKNVTESVTSDNDKSASQEDMFNKENIISLDDNVEETSMKL